ncbi:MAG: TIGR03936 family radical SAM-associated protein [Lachnospiraceae bacterium]|nr:TIGR03936 family radical SAM-associated protein [Lachnospiraceae bacterium]
MKVRIRFSKQGSMKFIGHLDVMRYFQKLIRRSGIDAAYTEGIHPHMIMSFASPLGIGLTSDAEYMDIELNSSIPSMDAIRLLNEAGTDEMKVTGFVRIPDGKANKAMTLVAAADYELRFREGYAPDMDWEGGLADFFNRKEIPVLKKTKHAEKEVNIRPMIYDWAVSSGVLFLKLAAGSEENLKPALVMDAYLQQRGFQPKPFSYLINRCEIYADTGSGNEKKFVSLYDLGTEVL